MKKYRIALANIRFPSSPDESVILVQSSIAAASELNANIICFAECYVPGYRGLGRVLPPPDRKFLDGAWSAICQAASTASIVVVLGTERIERDSLMATTVVINADGTIAGFQDKVQVDPTEDDIYQPGAGRQVFQAGPLTFGVSICHEGFRYPETVRWAAQHGAQLVFHPHLSEAEDNAFRPTTFADPNNTFHEKAMICRAAENTCYFASVNYASPGSPTTSAVIRPDGTVHCFQAYGQEGLLIADLDLSSATGFLASRFRPHLCQ